MVTQHEPKTSFGAWLRLERENRRWSRTVLERRSGCSSDMVRKIETGERSPSEGMVEALLKALNIPDHDQPALIELARRKPQPLNPARPILNLPNDTTLFIGRQSELQHIQSLLNTPNCRLITLVGAGGVGKTRLALTAVRQNAALYPDGVAFVALNAISNPEGIIPALAQALDYTFFTGGDPRAELFAYLRHKKLLIMLDNFEHLLAGAELLPELLQRAADITLLVTSRERLRLHEESLVDVDGLDFPANATHSTAAQTGAVQLFIQRARQVQADFAPEDHLAAIIHLTQLVHGNPLALELAASWMRLLDCASIVTAIEASMDFLAVETPGLPKRHQSIRAVFDETWKRLTDAERKVYPSLSVFWGDFSAEAALVVAQAKLPILASLHDKCLLRVTHPGRYELHELLCQYAEMKLDVKPTKKFHGQMQHAAYYAEFAAQRVKSIVVHQTSARAEFEAEIENFYTAWLWALEHTDPSVIKQSWETLLWYYAVTSNFHRGIGLLEQALEVFKAIPDQSPDVLYSRVAIMNSLGSLYFRTGDLERSVELVEGAMTMAESTGLAQMTVAGAGYILQANLMLALGHIERAREAAQACVDYFDLNNTPVYYSNGHYLLGRVARTEGDLVAAQRHFEDGLRACEAADLAWGRAYNLYEMGLINLAQKRPTEALAHFTEASGYFQDYHDRWGEAIARIGKGRAARIAGDLEAAWHALSVALHDAFEIQAKHVMLEALAETGMIYHSLGRPERAVRMLRLVQDHPAGWAEVQQRAAAYLQQVLAGRPMPENTKSKLNAIVQTVLRDVALQRLVMPSPLHSAD